MNLSPSLSFSVSLLAHCLAMRSHLASLVPTSKQNSFLAAEFCPCLSLKEKHPSLSPQYSPMIAMPTSWDGRRSLTKKLIMLSDFMSKLHPKKKTPKTTVNDSTQRTAIWTTRVIKRLRSSGSSTDASPSVATTIPVPLQQPINVPRSWDLLAYTPCSTSVWLNKVPFILYFDPPDFPENCLSSNFKAED
uniref:Uncharacterized protein n=1 Tax=Sphaerodactylus townsendi TaxID=933632 RepID=A0ACB8EU71_9SAUR